MSAVEHKHAWRMTLHFDGCHYYSSAYACECGATASTYSERDVKGAPYSRLWMSDDEGGPMCDRCGELLAGAEPKHDKTVTEKE